MQWAYIVSLIIGTVFSLVITFYIIRNAVISAMRETLDSYTEPMEILRELSEIRKHLSAQEKQERKPESQKSAALDGKTSAEEAYLIEDEDKDNWECSHCGQKQRSNRSVCFNCGANFV